MTHATSNCDSLDVDMSTENNGPSRPDRAGLFARLLHSTGAGAVAYGLGIVSNLLLLPMYLRFWSVALYGEWMALYSAVSYLASLDFGVTSAAISAATMAYARNDWAEFKRVQGTAWVAALVIAATGGVVIATMSLFYFRINQWLGLTVLGGRDSRLVFCCLAISLLANIPGRQLIAVYIAIGEFAKYQWLFNAFALLTCIVTAVALSLGARPVLLAAVIAATTLLTIGLTAWILYRRNPHLIPHLRDADWATARTLAAPTGQTGLSMLATALTLQGPVIVLSRALGGPAVALFTTTRTVASVVRGTVMLLRLPLRPELAAASAQSSKDTLRRLFRIAVGIDTITAISLSAALWSGGVWLIRFWSRDRIVPDPTLLHLLLIVVVLEGFLQVMASAGWATNQIQGLSFGQLGAAVISLVLAVDLVGRFGPSAIPLGMIISLIAIMMPIALRSARKAADLPLRYVSTRLLLPFAAVAILSAALTSLLASLSMTPAWLPSAFSSLLACCLAVFTVATVFLTANDRRLLRDRVFHKSPRGPDV
jgi:O-antigen/teichoic acid export membrane protein